MFTVHQPKYLFIPGFLLWVLTIFLSIFCMPEIIGVPLAAVLILALISAASLLHPIISEAADCGEIFFLGNGALYVVCAVLTLVFAYNVIPWSWGAAVSFAPPHSWTWLQVSYFVVQQICYFGVHAFVWKERKPG